LVRDFRCVLIADDESMLGVTAAARTVNGDGVNPAVKARDGTVERATWSGVLTNR
jgi:hypothetical protein